MRVAAILNRDSGTLRTMDLDAFCAEAMAVFAEAGHELQCHVVSGSDVLATIERFSVDPDVDAMIAAGGDGTISSAAAIAHRTGKVLGVLPAGTMNLFARALGVPPDIRRALHAVAKGTVGQVDLAAANNQPFVHQFGVGIHARLVRIRNGMVYRSRVGKMLASLRAIAAAAINPPRFEVEFEDGSGRQKRMLSGIAVSNNPLDDGPVPVAQRLDTGRLGVYFAGTVTTGELISLVVDVLVGRWRANPQVTELESESLVLHFPKRKREVHAVIDGELIELERDVELTILPLALSVIFPAKDV
ncbi:diacylglycerol kinase family protein [Devosia sp.]|uniref:diacylglycerol/lipid kinase family protein n=1 Tax=Devosia sp. TaxID=1871048 RepID=UPI001B2BC689|nr:diacylglycerol kinase family protein [Devosia sp.]MBO9587164.1 diacylglycerol kinase family lipid kinase [Devosia sp.]